jgi:transcriptional regulator with XRE-family HTH domain
MAMPDDPSTLVSNRLKALRCARELTLRDLAALSGLSANTISLIEHGRTSPTIVTLHRLATALGVKVTDLIEESSYREVIYLPQDRRHCFPSKRAWIESLGAGLQAQTMEAFLITLEPGAGSGIGTIVHPGHELVFCLQGRLAYEVNGQVYVLEAGDSLLFEAGLPHCWCNQEMVRARAILILQSAQGCQDLSRQHF